MDLKVTELCSILWLRNLECNEGMLMVSKAEFGIERSYLLQLLVVCSDGVSE